MRSGIYQIPMYIYSPFLIFILLQSRGRGHGPLCPSAVPVTVVQPGIVNGGQRKGAKRPSGGGGGGGKGVPPPTVGRFYENSCMKTAFSCTLNAIVRG